MAKYDQFFVNVMMVEELGLQVPDPDDDIIKEGVIMFLAFAGFGAMPLLGYALVPLIFPHLGAPALFNIACIVTALTLFVMGAVKSKFRYVDWGLVHLPISLVHQLTSPTFLFTHSPTHPPFLHPTNNSTRNWLHSGLEVLLLGGVCAFLAYEIGHLVSSLLGAVVEAT